MNSTTGASNYDDAGHLTKTIQNYTDGNPATGGSDEDVTVERTYNSNGTLATLTAKNPTTGTPAWEEDWSLDMTGIGPIM